MIRKNACSWVSFFVLSIPLIFVFQSCSVKKYNLIAPYVDSLHTITIDKYPFEYKVQTIQPYEFVEVRFAGLNPDVSNTLNNYGGTQLETQIAEKGVNFSGQQVDKGGFLEFPLIGKVKAAGLTTDSLRAELLRRVDPILRDPYIYVGLPRRGVTFIGEVKQPATYVFSKERANILEFLAQTGSVTDNADLTKVKVYRETADGKRLLGNVNLNDSSLFSSPFFYPIPNDVVYIPSSKRKLLQSGTSLFPYISLLVSVLSISLTYILRK